MLSDRLIRYYMAHENPGDRLVVAPTPADLQIQPASLELRLGSTFKNFVEPLIPPSGAAPIDVTAPYPAEWLEEHEAPSVDGAESFFRLDPGVFTLATTIERVELPACLAARVEGRSSLARLGLVIHATAGFVDPGFRGTVTLEMVNHNPRPLFLKVGMRICQLSFFKVDGKVARPYGHLDLKSKYQNQAGATPSRAYAEGDE
jgi:dCTP deaminase